MANQDELNGLAQELQMQQSNGLSALILDLRFDPGGLLNSAIAVSTWFHGSQWPPGNHGIMPLGCCSATIDAAVVTTSSAVITPGRSGSAGRFTEPPRPWRR